MKARSIAALMSAIALFGVPVAAMAQAAAPRPQGEAASGGEVSVIATPAMVREIQFLLQSIGIDPGPIDGIPRELTNRALHLFQTRAGLPVGDIEPNRPVAARLVAELRRQAALVLLKGTAPTTPASAPPAPAPTEAASVRPPAPPPPPPPDPFASCEYNAADFRVGTKQYTPQSFLDEGFDGSTARAVTNLRQRLVEARQIAEKIGGTALLEVQRQARVIGYLECRLKIENATGTAK